MYRNHWRLEARNKGRGEKRWEDRLKASLPPGSSAFTRYQADVLYQTLYLEPTLILAFKRTEPEAKSNLSFADHYLHPHKEWKRTWNWVIFYICGFLEILSWTSFNSIRRGNWWVSGQSQKTRAQESWGLSHVFPLLCNFGRLDEPSCPISLLIKCGFGECRYHVWSSL